jgi:hypothetical protein
MYSSFPQNSPFNQLTEFQKTCYEHQGTGGHFNAILFA